MDPIARPWYANQITLHARDARNDIAWRVVLAIRAWLTQQYNADGLERIPAPLGAWNKFKRGNDMSGLDATLYLEAARFARRDAEGKRVWACRIHEHPDPPAGYAARAWTSDITLVQLGARASRLTLRIAYEDENGFFGPCQDPPPMAVPPLVRLLADDPELACRVGPDALSLAPLPLHEGDEAAFWGHVLSAHRTLPIAYIGGSAGLTAQAAAACAAGSALVYQGDEAFDRAFARICPSAYSCPTGALRVYLPGVDPQRPTDHSRHRFFVQLDIRRMGTGAFEHMLRRGFAATARREDDPALEDVRDMLRESLQAEREAGIRERLGHDAQLPSESHEALSLYLAECERAKHERQRADALERENRQVLRERNMLQARVDSLTGIVAHGAAIEQAMRDLRLCPHYPDTAADVGAYFARVFSDRIAFTNNGLESLKSDHWLHRDLEPLWNALYAMATELYDQLISVPGGINNAAYERFNHASKWRIAFGEGPMTHQDNKLMRGYVDRYNDQEIVIEAHLKRGVNEAQAQFIRIYFAYDVGVAPQILIGHCGSHKINAMTKHMK